MKRPLLQDFQIILLLLMLSAIAVGLLMPAADCNRFDDHRPADPAQAQALRHACKSPVSETGDLLGES